jgi:hypothetical protein
VLASIAGEVAVVAVDHRQTGVHVPVALSATSVGQPPRRQRPLARFVKPMYPPTVPAAAPERTNLIVRSRVLHVCTESLSAPRVMHVGAATEGATASKAITVAHRLTSSPYACCVRKLLPAIEVIPSRHIPAHSRIPVMLDAP